MTEETQGGKAAEYVSPGGDDDKPGTLDEVLQQQARRAFLENFADLGIELDPTKGEITGIIDYLFAQWEALEEFPTDLGPWATDYLRARQEEIFWQDAEGMLAPYAGFGADGGGERAGDPLNLYFQSVDRMMKTMMGPYPEARYFGAEGYRESFESLTPSSFDEWLQAQEEDLRAEYTSELFLDQQGRMKQFGAELAGLSGDERHNRMLQLSEEAGLGGLTTYEDFLAEKRPQLEQKYRYLKPLGDEPQKAWEEAAPDLFGEGVKVTPLGQFMGRKQEGLMQQYEDTVREQLRGGTALGELPDLENWFREQRAGVEQSFELSGPQYTGKTPTGVFKPKKRIM